MGVTRQERGDTANYSLDLERKHEEELEKLKKSLALQGIAEQTAYAKKLFLKLSEEQTKERKKREQELIKYSEQLEKDLDTRDRKRKVQAIEEEYNERKKRQEELYELEVKEQQQLINSSEATFKQKMGALGKLTTASIKQNLLTTDNFSKAVNKAIDSIGQHMQQVMTTFSKYQSTIETRLQGSGQSWGGVLGYSGLYNSLMTKVGINPYIKTENMLNNLSTLVEQGIAFNLEQRTFLATISEKVANTFDAFDSNLARIVRIQQADSTAARLGLEAFMTRFLNNMFSDTSYLNNTFDTVTANLLEATSQLSTQQGVEFEGVIQKWLGSLSSVGLSESTASSLSQALGYLATGDVQGLSSSGMQNLLVMAASRAGLSYSEMLTRGITLDETNTLLGSIVEYLQEIGQSTNQVVKNQYASTFGVSLSDIRSAQNLTRADLETISKSGLSYGGTIDELYSQLGQVASRTSLAEMMGNLWENTQYSLYSNIAGNPALYALWQVTDFIQGLTGGINIPAISVMGNMVDLETTVENLMKLGIVGVGSLGMIGDIVSGVGSTFAPASMLSKLGITSDIVSTSRGTVAPTLRRSGFSTSQEQYISQSSGDVFYQSTLASAKESANQELTNASSDQKTLNDVYTVLTDGTAKAVPIIDDNTQLKQLETVCDYLSDIRTAVNSIDAKLGYSGLGNINPTMP